ncbi:MAG: terminase small subunit [Ruminococcaceae bacterium]|nr:terminase small subunit [Oscillospiraceae bacterium]
MQIVAELENKRHERFCQEYLVDLNGTQAAIRAGYKERNAASQASDLLRNPNILARVGELRKEQRERLALNADFVVLELIDTYKKCKNPTPVKTLNPKTGRYEECGVYGFDSKGALKALEQLDKHIGIQGIEDNQRNNLLEMLKVTGEDINTDDLQELQ